MCVVSLEHTILPLGQNGALKVIRQLTSEKRDLYFACVRYATADSSTMAPGTAWSRILALTLYSPQYQCSHSFRAQNAQQHPTHCPRC